MTILAIIQGRTSSSRLTGKMLLPLRPGVVRAPVELVFKILK